MKNKYLLLSSIILLISCSNGGDIISLSSNSSISVNELKEYVGVYEYNYLDAIKIPLSRVEVYIGSSITYVVKEERPEFKMCGDSVKLEYYGEIEWLGVPINQSYIPKFQINGELVNATYIKAEVKQVEYSLISVENGRDYCLIDDKKFEFIVTDKKYHFSSLEDFEGTNKVYASYYEGIIQALYSFDPLK